MADTIPMVFRLRAMALLKSSIEEAEMDGAYEDGRAAGRVEGLKTAMLAMEAVQVGMDHEAAERRVEELHQVDVEAVANADRKRRRKS